MGNELRLLGQAVGVLGALPTPGLIDRLPDPNITENGGEVPGRGPEDLTMNITPYLYSVCIMRHYFTPQMVFSPTEPSGRVISKGLT